MEKSPSLCAWNKCQVRLQGNERREPESEKQIWEHVRKSGVWELRPGIPESLNSSQFFKSGEGGEQISRHNVFLRVCIVLRMSAHVPHKKPCHRGCCDLQLASEETESQRPKIQ